MNADEMARIITVAVNFAGGVDRGTEKGDEEEILLRMRQLGVAESHYNTVYLLMNAFLAFAKDVRAAALKKRSIPRVAGETPRPEY